MKRVGELGGSRAIALVIAAMMALLLPITAAAQDQTAVFSDTDPPPAPFEAHQSMLRFVPGAEAPLHHHGGAGYITVLSGELTLVENGNQRVYRAGESFIETTDTQYKGGNYTDQDMTLMVTYLVPSGEPVTTEVDDPDAAEPPETQPEPIAETVQEFSQSFEAVDLVHNVQTFESGAATQATTADGDILMTLVTGSLVVTINGEERTVNAGSSVRIEAGSQFAIENANHFDASVMTTEFIPSSVGAVLPATGSPSPSLLPVWLLLLGGMVLFVSGSTLRMSVSRA